MAGREVYFEHFALGSVARCTAIDSLTGLEVSVMGPISSPPAERERIALQKLKMRLKQIGNEAETKDF